MNLFHVGDDNTPAQHTTAGIAGGMIECRDSVGAVKAVETMLGSLKVVCSLHL